MHICLLFDVSLFYLATQKSIDWFLSSQSFFATITPWLGILGVYSHVCPTDSVEDGEKLIQTALDAFGRIGAYLDNCFPCFKTNKTMHI